MLENSNGGEWVWSDAVRKAQERLEKRGLIRLPKPQYKYMDLGEIDNIEEIGDIMLANMMVRYLSWYSFSTVELAYAGATAAALDEMYSIKQSEVMDNISKNRDTKILKDVLKGMSVYKDDDLQILFQQKMEVDQVVRLLEGTVKGLEIRCRALENESIRRATARKVEAGSR